MDYKKAFDDKKAELKDLNERRNNDRKLVTSDSYVMKDVKDRKITDIINVTMNRLRVFKAYVEAALNKADEKVVVESDDKSLDTSIIEEVIRAGWRSANHRLDKRGGFRLEPFFDQQACMNGEIDARVMFQWFPAKDGKEAYVDTDITSWEAQNTFYDRGPDGLAWGAYEIKKSKAVIESEKWAVEKNFTISGKSATLIDLWAPEVNIIWVDGKLEAERPHSFKVPPICVQKVPIGSMFADELEYQCESIFFLVRGLLNEYNRCLSILQTLNLKAIKAAIQEKVAEPGGLPVDFNAATKMGSSTGVLEKGAISLVPYGDARNSMILALREIKEALDDGTLSRIMLGDLPGEMSAVALIQIEQGQGQVYMPRLGTRGLEKQQITEMFISQLIAMGQSSFELGTPGHMKTFKTSDLEGEYEISFRYSNKSPETDFARLAMARQYKDADLLDELSIMTDVMKRDDPEGDLNKLNRQRLRRLSPQLKMYDGLMALAELYEQGDESAKFEIDIIEAELGVSLDEMLAGKLPQAEQEPKSMQPAMPSFISGGRSSAQKAADLERTPVPEEGGE